jgi:poly(A) polymerase
MATPQKQWGVTPPISQSLPTDSELAANDALIAELKKQNNFESLEETERRSVVTIAQMRSLLNGDSRKNALQLLQKITVEFVRHISREVRKLPQNAVDAAGGKIFTYGSYRLGVYGPGAIALFQRKGNC